MSEAAAKCQFSNSEPFELAVTSEDDAARSALSGEHSFHEERQLSSPPG